MLKTKYEKGVDWPLTYDDLEPWYCQAEQELGVACDHEEWNEHYHGAYRSKDFPMRPIAHSYSDQQVMKKIAEKINDITKLPAFKLGVHVLHTPQARNSKPYSNDGAQELRPACEGNGNCIPVCPIKAKYDATVHLAVAKKQGTEILAHCVVSKLKADATGLVTGVSYIDWRTEDKKERTVKARHVVLATHAVENAKLLLWSNLANRSDQVGRNLMDHLNSDIVGLFKTPLYTFRGPQGTASIPMFCDGPRRRDMAAFNITFGNDGWGRRESPEVTLANRVDKGDLGTTLRYAFKNRVQRQLRFSYSCEQLPSTANRITIGQVQDLGIPRPLIQYKIDDYSSKAFAFAHEAIRHLLRSIECEDIGPEVPNMDFNTAGHPMGTTRMGTDPKTSVVDAFGRSHDHPNLYILGTSVFPTGATANPTLTIAALTLRTIDSIKQEN